MTPSSARPTSVLRGAAITVVTLGLIAGLALVGADAASAAPDRYPAAVGPASIALPVGFQPEGIALGARPVVCSGSRVTGDIDAADLRTGKGRILSQGPRTAAEPDRGGDPEPDRHAGSRTADPGTPTAAATASDGEGGPPDAC